MTGPLGKSKDDLAVHEIRNAIPTLSDDACRVDLQALILLRYPLLIRLHKAFGSRYSDRSIPHKHGARVFVLKERGNFRNSRGDALLAAQS